MAYNTPYVASNKADFVVDFSATDAETGDDIDFTGAEVSIKVAEVGNPTCIRFSATVGDGIEQPSSTVLELTIPEDTMATLCAGTYLIGGIYSLNGVTNQLFVGDFVVYEGIASL